MTSPLNGHQAEPESPAVDFLASLTPDELRALIMVATERTFPRGSKPMREGDRAEYVMVIIDGWTRISVADGGRDRVITERGPGQLIGEIGALRVSVRSATVTVLDTVRALVMRTGDFASYLGAHQRVLALVESQIDDRLTEEPYRQGIRRDHAGPGPAAPPSLAGENCTVVLTDVVGFGSPGRSDRDRGTVRAAHRDMLARSLGYLWDTCIALDQGDGLLIIAPPAIPTAALMERLHGELPRELRRHNRASDKPTRISLRVAANVGPVAHDTVGLTGEALIRASRLLD
ncbi:MAG TPA: cyclic nucleotide-binding domain-containing protein, partial [Acidimicrobiales bacterium]|nr:cyclic nucleotide-binding domain-containing protein [Acidimicrobiales bacterium]